MIWEKIKAMFEETEVVEDLFHQEWIAILVANVPLYSKLPADLKLKLHEKIGRFIHTTRFEGCNGLELTEAMILTIAAQACMLVLNRYGDPYPDLTTVYLYPTTFSSVQRTQDANGIVTEGVVHRLGESWRTGSVVLAWDSVAQGARNPADAHNVTFHEFAHQLDHENGSTDGAPPLESREAYRSWARIFSENYAEFLELVRRGKHTLIDPYGATNPAEFYAVATETFFEKPKQLHKRYPDLYRELKDFYGVDPQDWL
ncbi:zinc-dependent peptidase [Luteolibacter pohnpeiensis]|uniref:Zinc-dependent peptidase n=1 Tax=Luteolibacter pohnpeiensis TaxID=454153 RepID=A0A934S934_9BACT|nr:M90 family metallopeptidase [Luteolibacter pohnpeiensis]MBK1883605.1 zinc-dependent peptidase [Luteolibacter pohnpeiensis]